MEFSAKKDDLAKVLAHMQSIVEKRGTVPVLSHVKCTANYDNTLELLATDMDMCIEDRIPAQVHKAISTTIPAYTLYEIVRKIPDNMDIKFNMRSEKDDSIQIQVGFSEFSLPTIKAEEFPSFEGAANTLAFRMSADVMRMLLSKTKHAISNDETRYYLNGIYLHATVSEEGVPVLRAVATDGHRLAKAQTIQPAGAEGMPNVIIPKKTVLELIKLLDGFAGEIEVAIANNKIIFYVGTSILTSKLIDGKFPDYERVIPKNNDKTVKVAKKELENAIDLVISISNDRTRAVKLGFEPNKVTVLATSEMNGNARGEQEVPAEFNSLEVMSIGFNSRYVLDALSAIEGDMVQIKLSNNLGAVIAQDMQDANFLYILMPMQV